MANLQAIKIDDNTTSETNDNKYPQWLEEAIALQKIESNPLSQEDIDMFLMFEQKGWSNEKRRQYIISNIKTCHENKI